MSPQGRATPVWLPCLLALVVSVLSLSRGWPHTASDPAPARAARMAELLVPGLFGPVSGMAEGHSLVTQALLAEQTGPWELGLPLHVGLTPLVLALLALVVGRGRWALAARLGLALSAALAWGVLPLPRPLCVPVAQGTLAVLAGCGLHSLLGRRNERAELGLALLCLGLTVTLVAASVAAGAATDAQALQPLLTQLPPDAAAPGPGSLAASAKVLRQALDDAALSSFVCLGALLGLLRWRGTVAGLLVCVASAAELALLSGR